MRQLIKDLIPHAPQVGLYVEPNIPQDKLENAFGDYAKEVRRDDVIALFDATLMGSAKDGALFTSTGFVFQNNDLEPVHTIDYEDIVDVSSRRKLIGGRRVVVSVNRGRATFRLEMDFSGKPDAAQYVTRFLKEAMLRGPLDPPSKSDEVATDKEAVRRALENLHSAGKLSASDLDGMLDVIETS